MAAERWTRTSFGVLFTLYAAGLLIWLTLGLLPTLSAILPSGRHVLESVAMQGGALGTAADRIMSADMSMSTMSMSTAGVLVQYGFSALNFGLGLMLAVRRPDEPVPRLLAFALLGTAATFNQPSHRAFYITGSPWPIAIIHFTFHIVSGVCYLWAVLLFPDGTAPSQVRMSARGQRVAAVAVTLVTTLVCWRSSFLAHPQFFVIFFGILIPVVGIGAQAGRTAHSDRAEVRVWLPGGKEWSHVWPSPVRPRTDSLTIGARHGGDVFGEIEVAMNRAEQSAFDRRLLEQLAGPAGLALSTVRLTYELRQRAADLERLTLALQQSRQRLLDARRDERQRLQREVADRVIRHMANASDAMARVRERARSTSSLEPSSAETELGTALDRLRVLSRGIYPPTLSESGLAVSLAAWPVSMGVPTAIQVDGADQLLRNRPELEACIYFCVVTVLGALADRGADRLSATVRIDSGAVSFRVSASSQTDISAAEVLAIRDRVEAFDGSLLELSTGSPQSAIAATIPLALTDTGASSVGTAGERWQSE